MTTVTPSPSALVASAFEDRIAREALVLAMHVQHAEDPAKQQTKQISPAHIVAECARQLASYLELLRNASQVSGLSQEEVIEQAIKYCETRSASLQNSYS